MFRGRCARLMFDLCWAFHVRLMLGFVLLDSFAKRGVLFSYSQEHCVCKLQRRWATNSSAFHDKCSSNTFAWVVGHDLRGSCLPYYERLHIHSLLHTSTTYHDRPNTELRNVCYGMPLVGIRCFTVARRYKRCLLSTWAEARCPFHVSGPACI